MQIHRRTFLGLLGGSIVAAQTPEIFLAHAHPVTRGYARISQIRLLAEEAGDYAVARASGAVLLRFQLAPDSGFVWSLAPEIVLRPDEPMIEIHGPGVPRWEVHWRDAADRYWLTTSEGQQIPLQAA